MVHRLLELQREEDERKFGIACPEEIELVENFCCMHLGINIRRAFLSGIRNLNSPESDVQQEYHHIDTLVHELCKLFSKCGVPEYGCGALDFPDYLNLELEQACSPEKTYYRFCKKISLDRQVGSRYFVTASNAAKIFFL